MRSHRYRARMLLLALVAGTGAIVASGSHAMEQTDAPHTWQGRRYQHDGDRGDHEFGIGMNGAFGPALRRLDLTAEQQKSVATILDAARPDMQKMRDDMHGLVETLQNTFPDDPKYAASVKQVTAESQQLAGALVRQVSDLRTKIYAVLTPEQKARLPELMKEMSAGHQGRRGPHPGDDDN
jgi:Spy/CpxP family protein refolding chaperone